MNIRRIITFAFIFAIVGLAIGLSSCGRMQTTMPDAETPSMEEEMPPMMDEGITIGVAVSLTGVNAEPYGIPMQEGLELAREEINMTLPPGMSITFVTEDTLSTAEGAVAAVQTLVGKGVPAIIGVGISTHLEQAFPIANEAGVIAFSPISSAAGLSGLGDYIFRTGLAVNILSPAGVKTTQIKLGYTKVATIYDAGDTYSTSSNNAITEVLQEIGVKVLAEETFETGDTSDIDVSAQLTNIMNMEPDAIFISALASQMTQVISQGRAIDALDSVHFIVPDLTAKEIQEVGDDAEGLIAFSGWSIGSDEPGNQVFVQNYQAKYDSEPGPWAAQAYATLHILANAMMKAQSTDPAVIRDVLAQTQDLDTILGKFSFYPNGEARYDRVEERVVHIVKDGKLQPFGE